MTIETLSADEFARLAPMVDANQKKMRELPNGMPSADFRAALPFPEIGNEQTGQVEQYRLRTEKPDSFGAYLSSTGLHVTTWTGDILAHVIDVPKRSRDGRTVSFRFYMDGREYYARGSGCGMYCGCKAYKGAKR